MTINIGILALILGLLIILPLVYIYQPNKELQSVIFSALISFILTSACISGFYAINRSFSAETSVANSYSRLLEEESQEPKEIQEYRKKLESECKVEIEKKKDEIRAEFQDKLQKELNELWSELEKRKIEVKLEVMSEWNQGFDDFKRDFDSFKAWRNKLRCRP